MSCMGKSVLFLLLWLTATAKSSFVSDPDHCKGQDIDCVECDSHQDRRCGDPFDSSLVRQGVIQSVQCSGVCSKWVQNYEVHPSGLDGSVRVRRTCSKNLELKKVSPYLVCIDESRRNGQLCFCDQRNCNGAAALAAVSPVILVLLWLAPVTTASLGWIG